MAVTRPLAATVTTGMAVEEPYEPALKPGMALSEALSVTSPVPLKLIALAEMSPPEIEKSLAVAN